MGISEEISRLQQDVASYSYQLSRSNISAAERTIYQNNLNAAQSRLSQLQSQPLSSNTTPVFGPTTPQPSPYFTNPNAPPQSTYTPYVPNFATGGTSTPTSSTPTVSPTVPSSTFSNPNAQPQSTYSAPTFASTAETSKTPSPAVFSTAIKQENTYEDNSKKITQPSISTLLKNTVPDNTPTVVPELNQPSMTTLLQNIPTSNEPLTEDEQRYGQIVPGLTAQESKEYTNILKQEDDKIVFDEAAKNEALAFKQEVLSNDFFNYKPYTEEVINDTEVIKSKDFILIEDTGKPTNTNTVGMNTLGLITLNNKNYWTYTTDDEVNRGNLVTELESDLNTNVDFSIKLDSTSEDGKYNIIAVNPETKEEKIIGSTTNRLNALSVFSNPETANDLLLKNDRIAYETLATDRIKGNLDAKIENLKLQTEFIPKEILKQNLILAGKENIALTAEDASGFQNTISQQLINAFKNLNDAANAEKNTGLASKDLSIFNSFKPTLIGLSVAKRLVEPNLFNYGINPEDIPNYEDAQYQMNVARLLGNEQAMTEFSPNPNFFNFADNIGAIGGTINNIKKLGNIAIEPIAAPVFNAIYDVTGVNVLTPMTQDELLNDIKTKINKNVYTNKEEKYGLELGEATQQGITDIVTMTAVETAMNYALQNIFKGNKQVSDKTITKINDKINQNDLTKFGQVVKRQDGQLVYTIKPGVDATTGVAANELSVEGKAIVDEFINTPVKYNFNPINAITSGGMGYKTNFINPVVNFVSSNALKVAKTFNNKAAIDFFTPLMEGSLTASSINWDNALESGAKVAGSMITGTASPFAAITAVENLGNVKREEVVPDFSSVYINSEININKNKNKDIEVPEVIVNFPTINSGKNVVKYPTINESNFVFNYPGINDNANINDYTDEDINDNVNVNDNVDINIDENINKFNFANSFEIGGLSLTGWPVALVEKKGVGYDNRIEKTPTINVKQRKYVPDIMSLFGEVKVAGTAPNPNAMFTSFERRPIYVPKNKQVVIPRVNKKFNPKMVEDKNVLNVNVLGNPEKMPKRVVEKFTPDKLTKNVVFVPETFEEPKKKKRKIGLDFSQANNIFKNLK